MPGWLNIPDMRVPSQKIASFFRVCPLGQHEDQPPRAGPVPAMQFRMFVVGKPVCLDPAHNGNPADLLHQRVQNSGKGTGRRFLPNRAINGPVVIFGAFWHQIYAPFDRPPTTTEIEQIEITSHAHMVRPQIV